ncbi:LacI family DNA-binding transcriptional regulator [Pseudoroseomonas globiformis]|uniref:LacI family DNA-binding transcriptional regulator n=1 Tax=Teichococcus globiformis TaxID=2307229 RepID=A0ABV7G503_9PROT
MPSRPSQRVTIKDLAREMGVSVATIARAFHPEADIAVATRAAVLRLAAERGYQPDALARSMITGRTRIVGVVVADLENPFYPMVLASLSAALQPAGFNTMLVVAEAGGPVDPALRLLLSYRPEYAIILATNLTTEATRTCAAAQVPLLYFNRAPLDTDARAVVCDNLGGAGSLARHMIAGGMRHPAFISGRADTSTNQERHEGFRTACEAAGLTVREEAAQSFTYAAGQQAARRLLSSGERPDGIMGASDILALGAVDVATREFGLQIPRDLMVAGFDDIPMSAWPAHDLTTVQQPVTAMVERTLAWIRDEPCEGGTLRLPARLIIRGTTRTEPAAERTCNDMKEERA